jgi:hypothetical protein
MSMFADSRHKAIGGIIRIDADNDEAGIWLGRRDTAGMEQLCALVPRQQGFAVAVLILDELECPPVGTKLIS